MVENFAWGMEWQWGNDKHPPLFGWITAAWFKLFPFSDAAYYLLNQLNLGIALWLLALAMRRFMRWDKVLLALVLTTLGTHFGPDSGYKYNANMALLPFVAGLVWSLLHAFERGQRRWFVLAGVFAAAALLTKYYALVLFAAVGLSLQITMRPPWRTWRKGAAISAATTLLLVSPHIVWSVQHDWPSVRYMHSVHQFSSLAWEVKAYAVAFGDCLHFSALALLAWSLGRYRLPVNLEGVETAPPRVGLAIVVLGVGLTLLAALVQRISPVSPWMIPVFPIAKVAAV